MPHFREVRNSLYLAYSPLDEVVAKPLALSLGSGLNDPVRLSSDALFASDANELSVLDQAITRCHAAVVVLSTASLAQLGERAAEVSIVLDIIRARTGAAAAILMGVAASAIPELWTFDKIFELPAATAESPLPAAALIPAKQWVDHTMPPFGIRTIGVPVSVLAMHSTELTELERTPDFITNRLGKPVADQYRRMKDELAQSATAWKERYQSTRTGWRPFSDKSRSLDHILNEMVRDLNQRALPKLKHRRLKLQWYPFDALLQNSDLLRQTYREVARAGLVMIVDEVSLFHPDLREAFQNSPFFNNDQVAIVTISPFDPGCAPLEQLLESETRRKLAGAFDRYAVDYDPQCELAVGDERRLKRWLHVSLPETVTRLQELQPDRSAMRDFFAQQFQRESGRPKGDYLWASGGRL
jgi:hypothetical protein